MRHEVTTYENQEGDPLYRIIIETEDGEFIVQDHNGRNWGFDESFDECRDAVEYVKGELDDD